MSFPPRQNMPPMGFMGMPPIPMPRPLMSTPLTSGPNNPLNYYTKSANNNNVRPLMSQSIAKPPSLVPKPDSGGPVTVFVGNITEKWPDAMIRQLLSTCGQVINWKRVQGASGKLQGFGFCEFSGPDAGLRAVRLLHDLEVGDKRLVVKVDAKTNNVLEEYKNDRKTKMKLENPDQSEDSEDYMDEEMKTMDEQSKIRIGIIFREFKSDLDSYVPFGTDKPSEKEDPNKNKPVVQDRLHFLKLSSLIDPTDKDEDLALEEGKREVITREISNFREQMKQEKEREEQRKKISRERRERERDLDRLRRERDERDRGSPKRRSRSPSGQRSRSRSRDRDRRERRDREDRERRDREREREREREKDRMIARRRSMERRSKSHTPVRNIKPRYREREEEEEALEQKRMERKAREKEAAYDERLREWEVREVKMGKIYKKEKDKKMRLEEESAREGKKLKQFLEDYNDEKHDPKYYKGKELQKRLAERAKELEADNKDRQREREELEDIKLKLLTNPDPATHKMINRYKKVMGDSTNVSALLKQVSENEKPKIKLGQGLSPFGVTNGSTKPEIPKIEIKPKIPTLQKPIVLTKVTPASKSTLPKIEIPLKSNTPTPKSTSNPTTPVPMPPSVEYTEPSVRSLAGTGFQLGNSKEEDSRNSFPSPGNMDDSRDDFSPMQNSNQTSPDYPKKKKMDVKDVFNQEEEDDGMGAARKRKLVPLDYGDEKKRKEEKIQEEKKKHIKSLIEKIPTEKDALFVYDVDWEMVDQTLIEKRIRPWINKKIVEYIGEPEPTLADFICSKVLGRSTPQSILDDVIMVLDEEAEIFVVKMWRLLVYEIESKKLGLGGAGGK